MKNLKVLRKSHGLTQEEISKTLNINRVTYTRYELGQSEADYDTLIKLANHFNTTIDFLLSKDETEPGITYPKNYIEVSSDNAKALFKIYNKLPEQDQLLALAYINGLNDKNKQKDKK